MQSNGITPTAVENAIDFGRATVGRPTTRYYDPENNISVIVSHDGGVVVTVSRGR
jgi:hypothetical protein